MSEEVRHLCSCGLPGFVDVGDSDTLLPRSTFGRYPCRRHYEECLEQKQRDLDEYLTCFKPESPSWPSEYQVQKALLESKVNKETVS